MLQLTQLTGFNARRGDLHKRGSGTAGILLDAAGVGARHHVGVGAAPITIGAAGVGSTAIVHAGEGSASITLDAAGVGARHHVGAGSAAIEIAASAIGNVLSAGDASITIDNSADGAVLWNNIAAAISIGTHGPYDYPIGYDNLNFGAGAGRVWADPVPTCTTATLLITGDNDFPVLEWTDIVP